MWEMVEGGWTVDRRIARSVVGNYYGMVYRRKGSGGLIKTRYIGSAFKFSRGKSGIQEYISGRNGLHARGKALTILHVGSVWR